MEKALPRREARENAFLLAFSATFGDRPLEELLEKLDKDMEANATNSVKLREIMEQKEKAQADLDEKMDRWVYLNDLAERIEAQKSEKWFFSDAIDFAEGSLV